MSPWGRIDLRFASALCYILNRVLCYLNEISRDVVLKVLLFFPNLPCFYNNARNTRVASPIESLERFFHGVRFVVRMTLRNISTRVRSERIRPVLV